MLAVGKVQLEIGADALSGDGPARTATFSSMTDPNLSTITDSVRHPGTAADEERETASTDWPMAEASADDGTGVDLEAHACVIVRDGGAATIALDGQSRSITMAAGRDWLVVESSDANGALAATLIDRSTGGHITLSLTDGRELSRHVPHDAGGVSALLDAMRPASAPDIPGDGPG